MNHLRISPDAMARKPRPARVLHNANSTLSKLCVCPEGRASCENGVHPARVRAFSHPVQPVSSFRSRLRPSSSEQPGSQWSQTQTLEEEKSSLQKGKRSDIYPVLTSEKQSIYGFVDNIEGLRPGSESSSSRRRFFVAQKTVKGLVTQTRSCEYFLMWE